MTPQAKEPGGHDPTRLEGEQHEGKRRYDAWFRSLPWWRRALTMMGDPLPAIKDVERLDVEARLEVAEAERDALRAALVELHDRLLRMAEIPPWNANPESMQVSFLEMASLARNALTRARPVEGTEQAPDPEAK